MGDRKLVWGRPDRQKGKLDGWIRKTNPSGVMRKDIDARFLNGNLGSICDVPPQTPKPPTSES
jgi:hypothetical protein